MPEPITIGAIITALGGLVVSAVNRLTENPITAYFLILAVLIADGSTSFIFDWTGVFGGLFTFIINQLGVPIVVFSWQLMILFGIFPVIKFVFHASTSK